MSKKPSPKEHRTLLALLRQVRLDAGLRQTDLAAKLKRPQPFVSRYESGERRLDVLEWRQVCKVVGISPTEFLARFEKMLNEA